MISQTLSQAQKDLFGKDFAFPLSSDNRGRLATISGQSNLEQALNCIIETAVGETLYYRAMGAGIESYVHSDLKRAVALAPPAIEKAIMLYEPRVKKVSVTATGDDANSTIRLEVQYTPISYAIAQNLVVDVRMK